MAALRQAPSAPPVLNPMAVHARDILRLLLEEADGGLRRTVALALAVGAAGSLLAALAPLALKHLIDGLGAGDSGPSPEAGRWLLPGTAYLLALGGGRALAECGPLLAGSAQQTLQAKLEQRFFAHVIALPLQAHRAHRMGALAHSLSQAAAGSQLLLANLLQGLPIAIELATAGVVLAAVAQPGLLLLFTLSALAYATVFMAGARRMRVQGGAVAGAALGLHARLADSLLNIEAIKTLDAGPYARKRFDTASATLETLWKGLHRQRAGIGLALAAIFVLSVGGALALALQGVRQGTLSTGGFVLTLLYIVQLVRPLEALATASRDVAQALAFLRPAVEVLRLPPEGPDTHPDDHHDRADEKPPAMTLAGVRLEHPGRPAALDGIDLHLAPGTSLAIVGPSGAGKSTLARIVAGLLAPSAGEVRWNGIPCRQLDLQTRRRRVGMVSQDIVLFDDTIAGNLLAGLQGVPREALDTAIRTAGLHPLIESLPAGCDTTVGERGLSLSGGERQRLAIARALLRRPAVLVLDEPTSMLDSVAEAAVMRELLRGGHRRTTVVVTHRLATAALADEVVVLQHGRIVERGPHADLVAAGGLYARLWQARDEHQPIDDPARQGVD